MAGRIHTVKRTRSRRVTLLLQSAHPDAGPYFLVDRAGFGAAWRQPASEAVPLKGESKSLYVGSSFTRRATWIPIFHRALLAFTLVDEDEDVTPKEAKAIADKTYSRLGSNVSTTQAERWAFHLLEKSRGGK